MEVLEVLLLVSVLTNCTLRRGEIFNITGNQVENPFSCVKGSFLNEVISTSLTTTDLVYIQEFYFPKAGIGITGHLGVPRLLGGGACG